MHCGKEGRTYKFVEEVLCSGREVGFWDSKTPWQITKWGVDLRRDGGVDSGRSRNLSGYSFQEDGIWGVTIHYMCSIKK